MKWDSETFKVPSSDDYLDAVLQLDERYGTTEQMIDKAIDEARVLPKGLLGTLRFLSDSAVENKNNREDRVNTLRAMAIGAGLGVMLAETAHGRPNMINAKEARIQQVYMSTGAPADEVVQMLVDEYENDVRSVIGDEVAQWIENTSQFVGESGLISRRHQLFFPVGVGTPITVLYCVAAENPKKHPKTDTL